MAHKINKCLKGWLNLTNINNYRSRIKLYNEAHTSNSYGGYSLTKTYVDTVWAEIIILSGREEYIYKQVYSTAQIKIKIRYRHDINTKWKIFYKKKYLQILSIVDLENRHDELEIICKEVESE